MRTLVYPADQGGCGHYRMIWPAEAVRRAGGDVHLRGDADFSCMVQDLPGGGHKVVRLEVVPEADVIVLQRPLESRLAQCIPLLQAQGIAVVVEIDDDFQTVSPRNVAWRQAHPAHSPHRNWRILARACALADMVTVSTPALAERYGKHGRCRVLPNYVPERYLHLQPERPEGETRKLVGWSGSILTHPDDLQVTRGAVARALHKVGPDWAFHAIGAGNGVPERLDLEPESISQSGWQDLANMDYPRHMAGLDVGIVPLELSAFNEGKSWLKGLEWAALGVPFVASPTAQYVALTDRGAGLIARNAREWETRLRWLMENEDVRATAVSAGRAVAATLTIEQHAHQWDLAWTEALGNRTKKRLRALN